MKLKRFRVKNFRSVIDSGWINCDDVTTLVGINESGKSNILLALWKLNPAQGGKIDSLHDLPVTKLSEMRTKLKEICFIEAVFELTDSAGLLKEELGVSFSEEEELIIQRYYDGSYQYSFVNENAQNKLIKLQKSKKFASESNGTGVKKPISATKKILQIILQYIPTFVYYSNYGNLASKIYLPHAIKWLNHEQVPGLNPKEEQVRTIRVLFDYVNLKPQEILDLGTDPVILARNRYNREPTEDDIKKSEKDKEQRALLLQSAGTKLTKEFREWWKQGEYKFRFQADGDYFQIWVSDDKRPEEVALELRSTGLQWFLSFYLVFLVECKGENEGSILLLDEAGLTLHPIAQKDLAAFFNKLAENNPIINTTHSPFIVDPENIDRCRVVFTDDNGGTVVSEDLRKGSGVVGEKSIYAVHAALGLTVSDVMLQGSRVVIVEGVSDQFYLAAIKIVLIREKMITPKKEIVFIPSGGVKGVPGIVGLVSAKDNDLPLVVLDSDTSGSAFRRKLESGLYKDSVDRILSIKEFAGFDQSEIEDLIPFDFISKAVDRIFGVQDDDEFEYEEGKPLVPQIEKYAMDHGVELEKGWKVKLARAFKKNVLAGRQKLVSDKYINMWVSLFKKFEL